MSGETTQKSLNAAAMREALEFIKLASDDYEQYGNTKAGALDVIYEKACAALASPSRNCDVGTVEEQIERHQQYCHDLVPVCRDVPVSLTCRMCFAAWAQMPYKRKEFNQQRGAK